MRVWRAALVTALFLFLLLAMFSPAVSRLHCSGKMPTRVGFRPATIDVKLERYRLGLGSLRKSHGSFWVTAPEETALRYEIRRDYGDLLDISLGDDAQFSGTFIRSTRELVLRTPQGLFVGRCWDAD